MKKIITISREFGAGGGEIGQAVSKKLNYEYYDKELIFQTARCSNVNIESIIKWDEKVPIDFGFTQSLFDFYNKPLNEKLFQIQSDTIMKIAEKGKCVIVGRNANSILKEFDSALHVFICADLHWRVKRMEGKMSGELKNKTAEEVRDVDKTRKKYCSYYTDSEFGVAKYYDICLNTSTLGIERCIDLICDMAGE
ncbi:MAG: cytidylate kinase-like family protein [Clostridia bacterium]|nr:cytidylate kinase-like family protein [Clostridia bacterium]